MASGVKINEFPEHVVDGMVSVLLDYDLADYYKLMATLHVQTRNVDKAKDCIDKYLELAIPEMEVSAGMRDAAIAKEMEDMDKWMLWIDPASLPKQTSGLIRKPKSKPKPKDRKE